MSSSWCSLSHSVFRVTALSALIYAIFLLEDGAYGWSQTVFPETVWNLSKPMTLLAPFLERCQIPSFFLSALTALYLILALIGDLHPIFQCTFSPFTSTLIAFIMPTGLLTAINYSVLNGFYKEYLVLHYPYLTTAPIATSLVLHFLPALVGLVEVGRVQQVLLSCLSLFFSSTLFVYATYGRMITQESLNFAAQLSNVTTGLDGFGLEATQRTMVLFGVVLALVNLVVFLVAVKISRCFGGCCATYGKCSVVPKAVKKESKSAKTGKSAKGNDSRDD